MSDPTPDPTTGPTTTAAPPPGRPHPADPGFVDAYSRAWTDDVAALLDFFAADGVYADMAMGTAYTGHDEIAGFHRFMLTFAPDTRVVFHEVRAAAGSLVGEWTWSGRVAAPLRLRDGRLVDVAHIPFRVEGVAVCRYGDDGRLTRHRDYWDVATLLHQAGVPVGGV